MSETYNMEPRETDFLMGRHRCHGTWYPVIREVAQPANEPQGKVAGWALKRYLVEELHGRIPRFVTGINVIGTVVGEQSEPGVCFMEPLDSSVDRTKLAREIGSIYYPHLLRPWP